MTVILRALDRVRESSRPPSIACSTLNKGYKGLRPPMGGREPANYILGVPSKNIAGKLNLAPLRPRAAPIAPMGRHNRSGGQIFNWIAFGGDVGTIYMISPLQSKSMHCMRT